MPNEIYLPQLSNLIKKADEDWSSYSIENIVHYGINIVDFALYGIDIERGELIGIQAPEKNRKTTLVFNILFNIAEQYSRRGINSWICFDTLESGMLPAACRDQMIAMATTKAMVIEEFRERLLAKDNPTIEEIRARMGDRLRIGKDFLRYEQPNLFEQKFIEQAKNKLSTFPISIFGPSFEEGNTRNIQSTIERWELLYNGEHPAAEGQKYRIFVTDNVQLYSGYSGDKYTQLEEIVELQAHFMVTHPGSILIAVSQMGKGSLADRRKGGEGYAKGGGALAAEATVLFETGYDKDRNPDYIVIRVPRTRKKPPPTVYQPIDRESEVFLGKATTI